MATECLHVLDWTGRHVHPNKRGILVGPPPRALGRLPHDASPWPRQVLAVGSDFHRAVGAAESLIAKAAAMGQRWLHGIGAARRLSKARCVLTRVNDAGAIAAAQRAIQRAIWSCD